MSGDGTYSFFLASDPEQRFDRREHDHVDNIDSQRVSNRGWDSSQ